MERTNVEYINKYYDALGKKAIISNSVTNIFKVLFSRGNKDLVTNNLILRVCGRIRRLNRSSIEDATDRALQYYALLDAFSLLSKKSVPVYFYNRIGKKQNYDYSANEQYRMKSGLSFPVMYKDIDKYEEELKKIFGSLYSKDYIREIGKIPQVVKVGNEYRHEDYTGQYINVVNGKRITKYQPQKYARTIHVYGRCGAFGYAVEDKDTLPSFLQNELIENGIDDIRVVNHGLWGGTDEYLDHNFLNDAIGIKQCDIVLFYRVHFDKRLLSEFIKRGVRYKELTDEWHNQRDDSVTFFDKPGHMNAAGYKLMAKLIREDLMATQFSCGDVDESVRDSTEHLNYYLTNSSNDDFEKEVKDYTNTVLKEFPLTSDMKSNGAIVMNCNPFTYGHRYLIEYASKQVDRLYIFVVEEDKSFFVYKDRFEMVKNGVDGLDNVVVIPSGKFIISAYTFPEYFMKDYVKEKEFDVSLDVETFCKHIAPPLKIYTRFAGEEPFDPVTQNYNESMKRILPEYGMKFIEIPRFSLDDKRVINATKVRGLLNNKDYDALKEYVPDSTYKILMEKYAR